MSPLELLRRARRTALRMLADVVSLATEPFGIAVVAREDLLGVRDELLRGAEDRRLLARRAAAAERTLDAYEREVLEEIERSQGTCSAARGIVG